jgi:succinyl-diaminopimelate desuccinylase
MGQFTTDAQLAQQLASRTLELVDIQSESWHEAEIVDHVHRVLSSAGVEVQDLGDTCLFVPPPEGVPFVLLAGHLDTVPAQGNFPGVMGAGRVEGIGASDMKSGCAVMMELALAGAGFGYLFFGREEIAMDDSALTPVLKRCEELRAAHLAVMLEPTDNTLHAGCLGNINGTWRFHGRSAHSARPWQGENAIVLAAEGISQLAQVEPVEHDFGGLTFTEVVSVTKVHGGIAGNVIPDLVECHVNYRFPPGLSNSEAEERLRGYCGEKGELEIRSTSPSAPVVLDNPLVQGLVEVGDLAVHPKQAWTPVAEFAMAGIDAVNFGPGSPKFAHKRDEHVEIADLLTNFRTFEALAQSHVDRQGVRS